jgi:hypothetical protein
MSFPKFGQKNQIQIGMGGAQIQNLGQQPGYCVTKRTNGTYN